MIKEVAKMKLNRHNTAATQLRAMLPSNLQLAMDLCQEKGASSWLAVHATYRGVWFTLHKTAFRDALALRYGWLPANTPTSCACGAAFSVEHALSYPKGGFPSIGHNEIRDYTAYLLSESATMFQLSLIFNPSQVRFPPLPQPTSRMMLDLM